MCWYPFIITIDELLNGWCDGDGEGLFSFHIFFYCFSSIQSFRVLFKCSSHLWVFSVTDFGCVSEKNPPQQLMVMLRDEWILWTTHTPPFTLSRFSDIMSIGEIWGCTVVRVQKKNKSWSTWKNRRTTTRRRCDGKIIIIIIAIIIFLAL